MAQRIELKIIASSSKNQPIIDSVQKLKNITSESQAKKEVTRVVNALKLMGYLTVSQSELQNIQNRWECILNLGVKTEWLTLEYSQEQMRLFGKNQPLDSVEIRNLKNFKEKLKTALIKKGIPFSELRFTNYEFKGNRLNVRLRIESEKVRSVDKLVIRGYDKFPGSFKKFYLNTLNREFSNEVLVELENRLNQLSFIESTRKPEVLFKKDSTIIYIYPKKIPSSNVDAMVNLNTDESNKIQFTGIVDLKLNNILDFGENFNIYWNRVSEDRSEFKFESHLPYLFQSKLTGEIQFDIFRQDSTFLNTDALLSVHYPVVKTTNLGFQIGLRSSSEIEQSIDPNEVSEFSATSVGLLFEYKSPKITSQRLPVFTTKLLLASKNRVIENNTTRQLDYFSSLTSNLRISRQSLLHIENKTQLLFSKDYILNELFRIGGINTMRGFDEQSIFVSKYSLINTEYRFYSGENYLHTITDFAWTENKNLKSQLFYTLGLGYNFRKENNLINLAYATGWRNGGALSLANSRLLIRFVSFF